MARTELSSGTYTIQNMDNLNCAYLPNENDKQVILTESNDSGGDFFEASLMNALKQMLYQRCNYIVDH